MRFTLDLAALPAGYGEALLPLADAKAHLRVLEDDEDDLIAALRDAAIDAVEQYTGLRLRARTGADALTWRGECLPTDDSQMLRLGARPATALTSIVWLDSSGASVTGDVATLRIVDGDGLLPKPGESWPSDVAGGVTIVFACVLATAPPALIMAAKMLLATFYTNRESVVTSGMTAELSHGFKMLCAPYRRWQV